MDPLTTEDTHTLGWRCSHAAFCRRHTLGFFFFLFLPTEEATSSLRFDSSLNFESKLDLMTSPFAITLPSLLCNDSLLWGFFLFCFYSPGTDGASITAVFSLEPPPFIWTGSAKINTLFIRDPKLDTFTAPAFLFHRLCQQRWGCTMNYDTAKVMDFQNWGPKTGFFSFLSSHHSTECCATLENLFSRQTHVTLSADLHDGATWENAAGVRAASDLIPLGAHLHSHQFQQTTTFDVQAEKQSRQFGFCSHTT